MPEPSAPVAEVPLDISPRFNILGYPSSGDLARLAAEALATSLAHPDLLAINASFIGHPSSGPAFARITDLGATKSLPRATLSLVQEGEVKAF